MNKTIIECHLSAWGHGVEFLVSRKPEPSHHDPLAMTFEVAELKYKRISTMVTPKPTFVTGRNEAQTLMDQLWTCGFRPSEGSGSAGSLKATQDHLKDMQKIAFDLLDKTKLKTL